MLELMNEQRYVIRKKGTNRYFSSATMASNMGNAFTEDPARAEGYLDKPETAIANLAKSKCYFSKDAVTEIPEEKWKKRSAASRITDLSRKRRRNAHTRPNQS